VSNTFSSPGHASRKTIIFPDRDDTSRRPTKTIWNHYKQFWKPSCVSVIEIRILSVHRWKAVGASSDGHGRCQVSAGPVGVPRQAQRVQHLGPDCVLPERYQPDGRTVVPEVGRGKQMGRVQEVVSRRLVPETPTVVLLLLLLLLLWPLWIILFFMSFLRTTYSTYYYSRIVFFSFYYD